MGCGASVQASGGSNPGSGIVIPETLTGAAKAQERPPKPTAVQTHTSPGKNAAGGPVALDKVSSLGAEPESPTTTRVTDRKKKQAGPHDEIPTIFSGHFDEEDVTERTLHGSSDALKVLQPSSSNFVAEQLDLASTQGATSTKIPSSVLTLASVDGSTSDSIELDRFAPPGAGRPGAWGAPSGDMQTRVTLRPVNAGGAEGPAGPAHRYDDISLSDDDEDDQRFDLDRWRRYYKWNKSKHSDLLEFLWRRFDPKNYSMYCATYRSQDQLFAGFQGDNVVHGLCCRMECFRTDLFGILHTLFNGSSAYKVLGVFIFKGPDVPAELSALPDFEHFQLLKADTKDPLVRQFVGALVTGASPVPEFDVICSQEVPQGAAAK